MTGSYDVFNEGQYDDYRLHRINELVWEKKYKNVFSFPDLHFEWDYDDNRNLVQGIWILESNQLLEKRVYTTEQFLKELIE